MNIYLVQEDGEARCWQAYTMTEALALARSAYIEERREDEGDAMNLSEELTFYEDSILESCALIGELVNIIDDKQKKR